MDKWKLGLIFLVLSALSFTFLGAFFRNYFVCWFFTGVSQGKTILFFLFLAGLYFLPSLKKKIQLPKKWFLASFVVSITLMLALGFWGTQAIFNEYTQGLDKPLLNSTQIFFYYPEAQVSLNWLGFAHNHYFKPVITPVFYLFKDFDFDVALPLSGIIPPPMPLVGALLFLIALISFIVYVEDQRNSLLFLVYGIAGFGLLSGVLDGGLFSAVIQINATSLVLLLVREKIKSKEPLLQAAVFTLIVLALHGLWLAASLYLFSGVLGFSNLILTPKLAIALMLPLLAKSQFPKTRFLLAGLLILFVTVSFINQYPTIAASVKDEFGLTPKNHFYLKVISVSGETQALEELADLGQAKALTPELIELKTTEKMSLQELFTALEEKGIKAALLENPFWS